MPGSPARARQFHSFIGVNPLQTTWPKRGIVSGRVALLPRSAEIQPPFHRFSDWTSTCSITLTTLHLPQTTLAAPRSRVPLCCTSPTSQARALASSAAGQRAGLTARAAASHRTSRRPQSQPATLPREPSDCPRSTCGGPCCCLRPDACTAHRLDARRQPARRTCRRPEGAGTRPGRAPSCWPLPRNTGRRALRQHP